MDFDELLNKYLLLKEENQMLRKTIEGLKSKNGNGMKANNNNSLHIEQQQPVNILITSEIPDKGAKEIVNKYSSTIEKIELYMSLFRGREDVYAKRWENKKLQTSGYSPACANEWVPGICLKPKIKCSACNHKDYLELNKQVIENHLRGNFVAGVYPLLTNETCWFLAIDFDDEGWKKDISHKVNVTVVTRPASDFTNKDLSSWNDAIEHLKMAGIHLIFKPNIHQKFAIFDQKIVWYGSINLFSYGSAEESMMRIESTKIAYELIVSLEKT